MYGQSTDLGNQAVAELEPKRTRLVQKLDGTRRAMRQFLTVRCLIRVAAIVLALGVVLLLADWMWVLGREVRGIGLALLAGLAALLVARWGLAPRRRIGPYDTAGEVEQTFPELGQRVRTTLEYINPTPQTAQASPNLVEALTYQTEDRTSQLDLQRVVPWRSLVLSGSALGAMVLAWFILMASNRELRIAAARLFLLPIHYTKLAVEPGDRTLNAGSEVTIQATLSGRPVKNANLVYRETDGDGSWTQMSFLGEEIPTGGIIGTLETRLADCEKDLEYRVVAGPIESPIYHLKVLHPLKLQGIEASITPPAYTRRPDKLVKDGNFQIIAGSAVRFHIRLDRQPKRATVQFRPAKKDEAAVPPLALEIQGNELTGELPRVDQDLVYEITADAADGMHLDGVEQFRIHVLADRKPTVRFVKPKDQIEVTPTTEVNLKIEANDDFGLSKVGIVYQAGKGPKQTVYLKDYADQPVSLNIESLLSLEEHNLDFQNGVTYYAFAEDNHPDNPQRATTDLQFIDIRPYKRAYQVLKNGGT